MAVVNGELLYLKDAYQTACEATVCACSRAGENFRVVLNQTVFFPAGGGQPADVGMLGNARVLDVREEDGAVVHITDAPLCVGECVRAEIDWDVRFSRMQNHTGEHLLCGLAHRMYGCENVGFHLTDAVVTFDLDLPLTSAQVDALQVAAMRAVYENREVTCVSAQFVEDYRSKLEADAGLRVVIIDGYDKCACCAPHVKRTGEIGAIRILDASPHRGGTRLTLVCGAAAYRDYAMLDATAHGLMSALSVPRGELLSGVEKVIAERDALRRQVAQLQEKCALLELRVELIGAVAFGFLENAEFDTLRACANTRQEKTLILLSGDGKFMVRGEGAKELGARLANAFSGKGGGKSDFVQGKLTASREEVKTWLCENHR